MSEKLLYVQKLRYQKEKPLKHSRLEIGDSQTKPHNKPKPAKIKIRGLKPLKNQIKTTKLKQQKQTIKPKRLQIKYPKKAERVEIRRRRQTLTQLVTPHYVLSNTNKPHDRLELSIFDQGIVSAVTSNTTRQS